MPKSIFLGSENVNITFLGVKCGHLCGRSKEENEGKSRFQQAHRLKIRSTDYEGCVLLDIYNPSDFCRFCVGFFLICVRNDGTTGLQENRKDIMFTARSFVVFEV